MRNEERAALRANMAVGEGVLELPVPEKKEFRFKSFFTKEGFKRFGVRNFVILLSVLLIGAAVYANWAIFGGTDTKDPNAGTPVSGVDETTPSGAEGEKTDNYFASSQIERQRARDEAIEVLQGVVEDAATPEDAKTQALENIAAISRNIEKEANIESLVKAKGFAECVAVLTGETAKIIVSSEGLKPNQLSQILEIVYLQADILPANVTISEK